MMAFNSIAMKTRAFCSGTSSGVKWTRIGPDYS
jgi:hypothetical protein